MNNPANNQPRFVTMFRPAGTKSFRLAAGKLFDEFGQNGQNSPKQLLPSLVASPGYKFVQADQSGAEALVVAHIARDGTYRQLFKHGIKPHSFVAMHIFGKQKPNWFAGLDTNAETFLSTTDPAKLSELPGWKTLAGRIADSDTMEPDRPYYTGKRTVHACVPGDTEVLTQAGWIYIKDLQPNVAIANFNIADSAITFDVPEKLNVYDYRGPMYTFAGTSVNQTVTPNHKMPIYTNGRIRPEPAHITAKRKLDTYSLPKTGYLQQLSPLKISDALIKLCVAIQADGHYTFNQVKFHFRRLRKIDRAIGLLRENNIEFTVRHSHNCDTECVITFQYFEKLELLLTKDKHFKASALLQCDSRQLKLFVSELGYWDGSVPEAGLALSYYNTNKSDIDCAILAAHLCGYGTSLFTTDSTDVRKTGYVVNVNNRSRGYVDSLYTEKEFVGKVYCPTTATGYFLIRDAGYISVTGNSSYRMGWKTFQEATLKDTDGTVVLTKAQAEYYLGMFKDLFPEIIEWQNEVVMQAESAGQLHNLFGFPRNCDGIFTEAYKRELISWIPQSTVGCITHEGVRAMKRYVAEHGKSQWSLLNNKHDSFLYRVPEADAVECGQAMQRSLAVTLKGRDGVEFTMKSSVQIGDNWAPWHAEKNPGGMLETKV